MVTGWTDFSATRPGFVGPVVIALLVKWTGGWSGALLGIALAGLFAGGAVAVRASGAAVATAGRPSLTPGRKHRLKEQQQWAKYEIRPMPVQISTEIVALLGEDRDRDHRALRHWGFCNRAIHALLPGRRIAGTAVTAGRCPAPIPRCCTTPLACCGPAISW